MSETKGMLRLYEGKPRMNWPNGRMPDWVDERTRLYTGFTIEQDGETWDCIVTHHNGQRTTAYLTNAAYDLEHKGPEVAHVDGVVARHRKLVADFFATKFEKVVTFA